MNRVTFAVSPEIRVGGTVFTPKDMIAIGQIVGDDAQIELTTFQQLIVEMNEEKSEEAKKALRDKGLCVYETGSVVKNLSVCTFCKGAEEEGLLAARNLNDSIVGMTVPFTMRVGYTGCPNACGEPLVKDIGIVKRKETFEIYVGGQTKTLEAKMAELLVDQVKEEDLSPIVKSVVTLYQEKGKSGRSFSNLCKDTESRTFERIWVCHPK
ncbi:nitrite reductase [Brevibacillus centrosporus]|uniref:nitrite reductase n=1 Tax=Brevibacillus centrosporus TaxID=54910 RepID=UPI001174DAFD|nr:nitrite reductase [Brevibacillus centrosporus]MEC2127837.1 nitrite reductase [Brevibacillus centrosporus]GED32077.1 NAD(P)/FAD-dependent oxidoreductase [Brevibacillus centrosporus]